jgi:dihydroneopterin aldolase/2-amino-4-hydroxy-6-hydroxymethyldihydropteridine diphosphokinase
MSTSFISIGSNIRPLENILLCVSKLKNSEDIKIKRISNIYYTQPWGYEEQPYFLNFIVEIETHLNPLNLLSFLKEIEKCQKKKRDIFWGPRSIDLDIIFFDNLIIEEKNLVIPHKEMHRRGFVLYPLNELIPFYIHPLLNKTVNQILRELKDKSKITLFGRWVEEKRSLKIEKFPQIIEIN